MSKNLSKNFKIFLQGFKTRLDVGIAEDLMDLIKITCLTGRRARLLFDAGYTCPDTILDKLLKAQTEIPEILAKSEQFHDSRVGEIPFNSSFVKISAYFDMIVSECRLITQREEAISRSTSLSPNPSKSMNFTSDETFSRNTTPFNLDSENVLSTSDLDQILLSQKVTPDVSVDYKICPEVHNETTSSASEPVNTISTTEELITQNVCEALSETSFSVSESQFYTSQADDDLEFKFDIDKMEKIPEKSEEKSESSAKSSSSTEYPETCSESPDTLKMKNTKENTEISSVKKPEENCSQKNESQEPNLPIHSGVTPGFKKLNIVKLASPRVLRTKNQTSSTPLSPSAKRKKGQPETPSKRFRASNTPVITRSKKNLFS